MLIGATRGPGALQLPAHPEENPRVEVIKRVDDIARFDEISARRVRSRRERHHEDVRQIAGLLGGRQRVEGSRALFERFELGSPLESTLAQAMGRGKRGLDGRQPILPGLDSRFALRVPGRDRR
jgi:hypothetical protein